MIDPTQKLSVLVILNPSFRQGSGSGTRTLSGPGGKRTVGIGGVTGPDGQEMDVLHVDVEKLEGRTMRDEEMQVRLVNLRTAVYISICSFALFKLKFSITVRVWSIR